MKTPILGSSYIARSVNAADNRMVNLFPEVVPEGGKEPAFLNRCPGLLFLATVGTGPIRGLWTNATEYLYVVSGTKFYRVSVYTYTATELGTMDNTYGNQVSIADNGSSLFLANVDTAYNYNYLTNTFTDVSGAANFPGAVTVDYLEGFFLFNQPGSSIIWWSTDGLTFDATDFRLAVSSPDIVNSIAVNGDELWVFGNTSIEVWYYNQNPTTPFGPVPGSYTTTIGSVSDYAVSKMDNSLYWLGQSAQGGLMVYRSEGYTGKRISTHSVEWQLQQYVISPVVAQYTLSYSYQQDGHSFFVLVFPNEDTTWVYDASTQAWHERCGFVGGEFTRHRGNCQAFWRGSNGVTGGSMTVIGDYANGNIYSLDLDTYEDNGETQKWLRSWRALPPGQNNLTRTAHHSLQLDCEAGVGTVGTGDPEIMLRWSDDGGHTWSNELTRAMGIGSIGEYNKRVIWRRLGMTMKLRDRVYEISGSDPVKIAIMGAELIMSPT